MKKNSKIFVAGHRGLVGSAILKSLKQKGYKNLITRSREELNLVDCIAVQKFFSEEKPEYVFLAAAKVGGIKANDSLRAEFIYDNLMIQINTIHNSYNSGVKKLIFLGSTCIYPKDSPQPIKEEYLLTGPLEYTNEPYAIAKIAGIKMCESYNLQYGTNYITVMPTNLYGPEDNFDLETSHVLPALLRKIHLGKALEEGDWEAIYDDLNCRPIEGIDGSQGKKEILKLLEAHGVKLKEDSHSVETGGEIPVQPVEIEIWGSGKPLREFLWSEEMADACVFLMEQRNFQDILALENKEGFYSNGQFRNTHINIGTGREISIAHLAEIIKILVKFKGSLFYNKNKPEGTFRKLTDVSKIKALGWKPLVELDEGIYRLYQWYKTSIHRSVYLKQINRENNFLSQS